MREHKPYPEGHLTLEVGCKVSWRTYADLKLAEQCAEAAEYNAEIDAALGYDFGYCSPGSIDRTKEGHYRVCLP